METKKRKMNTNIKVDSSAHIQDNKFLLYCESCNKSCAVNAKFCHSCGAKIKNAFAHMRMKLPSLDRYKPSAVTLLESRALLSPIRDKKLRKKAHSNRKPNRNDKLPGVSARKLHIEATTTNLSNPIIEEDERELCTKMIEWTSKTKDTLELMLCFKQQSEITRSVNAPRRQTLSLSVLMLQEEFMQISTKYHMQAEVHDRCMDMIDKLKTFDATINLLVKEIQVTEVISEAKTTTQTIKSSIELPQVSPAKRNAPRITDADYVVTTTAGKKIFFKNRFPLARQEETQKSPPKVIDAFDDHSITNNKFKQEEAAVTPQLEEQKNSEDNKKVCRKSLRRGLFQCKKYLNAVVFQWVRHRKKFVFAWLEDKEEEDQLILHIYQPESSHTCKLSIPFPTMRFILPQGMVWYRRSELQRCEYARKDWEKKFTYIKKCIQWKETDDNEIELLYPIQFRQIRRISYRAYASLFGFVSMYLDQTFAVKVIFHQATNDHRLSLIIPERMLNILGGECRERLLEVENRRPFFNKISQKLYLEYTSRGFELLFPGVRARGQPRKHPMEASVAEYTEQKLQEERKKLKKLMTKCTSQTAIICQRSMEQYDAKLLEKKKMIQQKNLVKIQSYIRGMMARKVFKEQKKIYTLAAIFIQQNIRKHQRIVQARKERKRQFHNVFGHFFRYAMRINRTFIFLSARIDEIDANTNTFEVNLRLFHPLTDTVATLQVKATDLEWIKKKLSCQQVDQERVTRCAIINELVYHHLTLFRSQKHGILVLGLVKTHLI